MKSSRHSHLRAVLQQRAPIPQFGHGSSHTGNVGNSGTGSNRGGSNGNSDSSSSSSSGGGGGGGGGGFVIGGSRGSVGSVPAVNEPPVGTSTASLPGPTLLDDPLIVSPSSSSTSTTSTSTSTSSTQSSSSSSLSLSSSSSTSLTPTAASTTAAVPIGSSVTQTSSDSAIKPGSTTSFQSATSTSNGALIGGIGGGLFALVLVIFAAIFFFRRRRRNRAYLEAVAFRGSAMVKDPSPYADNRGLMSEKQAGAGLGSIYGVSSDYAAGSSPVKSTFSSAQVVSAPPSRFSDHTTPMFGEFQEYYQKPQPYPVHYPFPSPYEQQDYSRHTSVQSEDAIQSSNQHGHHSNGSTPRDSIPDDDFVDLTRSSISPFQAAQYLAISERLNTQVPILADRALPPLPQNPLPETDTNPFNDPQTPTFESSGDLSRSQSLSAQSVSGDSMVADALEFPLPPTPSHASITRYRVDSMPPMLPDINVQTRVSLTPMTRDSQLGAPMLPSKLAPARSPLVPTEITPPPSAPEAAVVRTPQNDLSRFSMYDVEDAYGGC